MVVIETYFPDVTYETNDATREDYSQTLGARAAAALPGASVTRWKRGYAAEAYAGANQAAEAAAHR